jgi:hypothetical protein
MPDWNRLVRERLASSGLSREVRDEVVAEIAAHLEDHFEHNDSQELSESEIENRAISETQWHEFARAIHHAKLKEESMNHRTRTLWLPAIVNIGVAAAMLVTLDQLRVQPRMMNVGHLALAFHLPWLCALPLSAALASLLARRAQAPATARLLAGLAPSLIWLAVFSVMGLALLVDRQAFSGFPLDYFAMSAVVWVLLPAFALLLGTLPFLRESRLPEASRHAG